MERYDVIIIGTGAGGGKLAHKLAPSGQRILLLERGGYLPREPDNRSSRERLSQGALPRRRPAWGVIHGLLDAAGPSAPQGDGRARRGPLEKRPAHAPSPRHRPTGDLLGQGGDSHRRAAPHRVRALHRNHVQAAHQLTHEQLTVKNQSIGAIMSLKDNTREHHHHGTFADGIAHPESFAGEDHVGMFAEGVAHPESFANEDHVGTFAEGIAHPESYAGEDHVGTFAEGA